MICVLDRYIAWSLMKGWLVVLGILLALFSLLALVSELEHVNARYSSVDAIMYIVYTMPRLALDLSPVVALLGSLVAFASLARHNELTAMRVAGMGQGRLLRALVFPTLALMFTLAFTAEFISATLYQDAELKRSVTRSGKGSILDGEGLWLNSGNHYLSVHDLRHQSVPSGIDLYEFDDEGRLVSATHADHARLGDSREWTLVDVQRKQLVDGHLVTTWLDTLALGPFWSREELGGISLSTAGIPLSGLYTYGRYLDETGQHSDRIQLAFWKLATIPLAAGVMVLLATPIGGATFTQRSLGMGMRLAVGSFAGILFYLVTEIAHTAGLLFEMDPAVITLTPILVVLAASALLLWRMR